jgi:hypothetical protein
MAGIGLEGRRRLADAAAAAARIVPAATGGQIVAAGLEPGPWIGQALKCTRDAIVDGEIDEAESLDHAIALARQFHLELSA